MFSVLKNQYLYQKLTVDDLQKFYILKLHINELSTNIGIIGNKKKFDHFIKQQLKKYKNNKEITIIQGAKSVRIFDEDIDTTYIQIENTKDLENKTFKKYI